MARFFCADSLEPGKEIRLSPEESHHLARVLRLEAGAAIELIDGKGHVATAALADASPKGARARVDTVLAAPPRSRLRVCFAIPKGAALDFIVRRATEIGVAAFQPLVTRHSLHVKEWNEERWRKIVVEVAKQCQEAWFPEILPPKKIGDWLATRDRGTALVFCDEARREEALALGAAAPCDLLVGAEGGWSDEEREAVRAAGALPMGLGRNRLRAETAAVVAAVLLKVKLGEM